jgi:hypothetical protein
MRWFVRSAVALTALGITTAQPLAVTDGWAPVLELRVIVAQPEGSVVANSNRWKLVKGGEPIGATVQAGRPLCVVGIGPIDSKPRATQPNVWRMTGEFLGEQNGRQSVRVTTRFERLWGEENTAPTHTQTLSLREGDSIVLDALTAPLQAGCTVHAVTMEVRLVMAADDPALARARYAADLWLVHTDPNGREQREHLLTNVDGSGAVPFMFNRLAFAVPQIDPRQGNAEATIQLTGAIRARTRTDGAIDLDIDTDRRLFGFEYPDKPTNRTPFSSRKTVTVKADETTAIDFPPGRGMVSLALGATEGRTGAAGGFGGRTNPESPAADGPPIEVRSGWLVLHTGRFFKDHKTQLLIRLRRLR